MISAFRICKTKHTATALSGEGARINGGRWNSAGLSMVYTSSSLSLATLEVLVHLEDPEVFARLFSWIELEIPNDLIVSQDQTSLPRDWCSDDVKASTCAMGDEWIRSIQSVALAVPSVVTPQEWNYLLNPAHPRFGEVRIGKIQPFRPDPRLIR
jgi:RES domain-containing protein